MRGLWFADWVLTCALSVSLSLSLSLSLRVSPRFLRVCTRVCCSSLNNNYIRNSERSPCAAYGELTVYVCVPVVVMCVCDRLLLQPE